MLIDFERSHLQSCETWRPATLTLCVVEYTTGQTNAHTDRIRNTVAFRGALETRSDGC